MRVIGWIIVVALGWAAPARADWFEARSPHFTVYAQGNASSVEATARQIEQFDAVLRYIQRDVQTGQAPPNPLTVYVAPTVSIVQRLCGNCRNVYGFYRGSIGGSTVFTPRSAPGDNDPNTLSPRIVLFHEYGHHFLLGRFAVAFPAWFSEGFAEFVGTAAFDKDSVLIGSAAMHRGYDLFYGNKLSTSALFASGPRRMKDADVAALYAQGWLLTHYITFDAARARQFNDYLKRLNDGEPSLQAATAAFGDLHQLDRDLDRYLNKNKLTGLRVQLSALPIGKIAVRPLTPGEEAMIGLRMESDAGVDEKEAPQVYRRAAAIAARFPDDPVAQGWFAEMAYDAGEDDAADAAAGRALAADPKAAQAMLYRARVHLRRAAKSHAAADFVEARSWIIKANRADPDNAEALFLFYQSFPQAGETPRKSAVVGLERAMQLVPQDADVRIVVARQAVEDGNAELARQALRPIAYSPHGEPRADYATRLLAVVDAGGKGHDALAAFDAEIERMVKDSAAAAKK